jgi:hypothetical protein
MELFFGRLQYHGIVSAGLLLLVSIPMQAATFLVSTSTALDDALNTARSNGQDDVITLVSGMYYTDTGFMYYGTNENFSLTLQCTEGTAVLDGQKGCRVLAIKTSGANAHKYLYKKPNWLWFGWWGYLRQSLR